MSWFIHTWEASESFMLKSRNNRGKKTFLFTHYIKRSPEKNPHLMTSEQIPISSNKKALPFNHNQFYYNIIPQTHHTFLLLCNSWCSFYTLPHTSHPPPTPSAPSLSSTWHFLIWIAVIWLHNHSTPAKFLLHPVSSKGI